MRLWTLHPKHLDPQGLVALWREGLLARAVLRGKTRGYKRHPQLLRFSKATIDAYLAGVLEESKARGYSFDAGKIGPARKAARIAATKGQVACEWKHLLRKLKARSPARYAEQRRGKPSVHPMFRVVPGPIADWERAPR